MALNSKGTQVPLGWLTSGTRMGGPSDGTHLLSRLDQPARLLRRLRRRRTRAEAADLQPHGD